MSAGRRPEEVRASIEANRAELAASLERLRGELERLADWRAQLRQNRQPVLLAATGAGFVLGGGIGSIVGLFRRR